MLPACALLSRSPYHADLMHCLHVHGSPLEAALALQGQLCEGEAGICNHLHLCYILPAVQARVGCWVEGAIPCVERCGPACAAAHSRTVSHQVPFTIWSTQLTADVGSDTIVRLPLDEIKWTCGTDVVSVCMWEHGARWLRANLGIQAGAAAAASGASTHLRSPWPPRAAEEHLEDGFRGWQLHSDAGDIIIGLDGGTWTAHSRAYEQQLRARRRGSTTAPPPALKPV